MQQVLFILLISIFTASIGMFTPESAYIQTEEATMGGDVLDEAVELTEEPQTPQEALEHLEGLDVVERVKTPPSIEQIIRVVAEQESVSPNLLVRIAWCESRFNPKAIGKADARDRGLYQWNRYYHPEVSDKCSFDVWCSSRMTARAIRNGKLNWWWSSYNCWKNYAL